MTVPGTLEYDALRDRMIAVETKLDLVLARLETSAVDHEQRLRQLEGRPVTMDHEERLRLLETRTASWRGALVAANGGLATLLAVIALVINLWGR